MAGRTLSGAGSPPEKDPPRESTSPCRDVGPGRLLIALIPLVVRGLLLIGLSVGIIHKKSYLEINYQKYIKACMEASIIILNVIRLSRS